MYQFHWGFIQFSLVATKFLVVQVNVSANDMIPDDMAPREVDGWFPSIIN